MSKSLNRNAGLTTRRIQRPIGIARTTMIVDPQYGWSLFVHPIDHTHGWTLADIRIAFMREATP